MLATIRNRKFLLFTFLLIVSGNAYPVEDMSGSADHPKLNRIGGTKIVAYTQTDYGEHEFLTAYEERKPITSFKEGKVTRLVYALQEGQTGLFALRNYQEAFAALGDVKELYTCKDQACPRGIGNIFVWGKNKRFKSSIEALGQMYRTTSYNKNPRYWSGEIQSDTANYTVSFYSASTAFRSELDKKRAKEEGLHIGQTFVHLNIVEKSTFKSELVVVEASEIQKSISEKGHIALYGLFFDTGKDQLKTESKPALVEIAKALKADNNLKVYVVGHTDNVGSLQTNQQLSERRAASIVSSLTTEFGIKASHLIPIGVGLAAPVTTNDTEEGRSLNRRVELVKR